MPAYIVHTTGDMHNLARTYISWFWLRIHIVCSLHFQLTVTVCGFARACSVRLSSILSVRGGTKLFTTLSFYLDEFHKFAARSFGCVMPGQGSGKCRSIGLLVSHGFCSAYRGPTGN